ncbi:MAG TPA: nuclear transport factor 2 family protein [Pyrinomonadaceae bacterium]|nr:nuclear transport factor 2 family protein [Pyrinomonadaceae bacterium]
MMFRLVVLLALVIVISVHSLAQNTNSSTPTERPRTTTNTNQSQPERPVTDTSKPTIVSPAPRSQNRTIVTPPQVPGSAAVVAAFNSLLDGIRKADVKSVTNVYWNSPRLVLFNNNGTVTKGWEQMRKNRESSYPDITDVKLDVRDVSVIMLGRDGALVSCLWTQSQTYKGTPETASGRMTLVFRRVGNAWKAVHLHTSPDKEDPSRIPPSERTPSPEPTPPPQ